MANEPVWLDAELLIVFNEKIVSDTGEPFHLRDRNLLESAIARPVNAWHYGERDAVVLAVTLLMGLARNHPFLQGNKRTAFAAADYFLFLNGYELAVEDSDGLADLIINVIGGRIPEKKLVDLLSKDAKGA